MAEVLQLLLSKQVTPHQVLDWVEDPLHNELPGVLLEQHNHREEFVPVFLNMLREQANSSVLFANRNNQTPNKHTHNFPLGAIKYVSPRKSHSPCQALFRSGKSTGSKLEFAATPSKIMTNQVSKSGSEATTAYDLEHFLQQDTCETFMSVSEQAYPKLISPLQPAENNDPKQPQSWLLSPTDVRFTPLVPKMAKTQGAIGRTPRHAASTPKNTVAQYTDEETFWSAAYESRPANWKRRQSMEWEARNPNAFTDRKAENTVYGVGGATCTSSRARFRPDFKYSAQKTNLMDYVVPSFVKKNNPNKKKNTSLVSAANKSSFNLSNEGNNWDSGSNKNDLDISNSESFPPIMASNIHKGDKHKRKRIRPICIAASKELVDLKEAGNACGSSDCQTEIEKSAVVLEREGAAGLEQERVLLRLMKANMCNKKQSDKKSIAENPTIKSISQYSVENIVNIKPATPSIGVEKGPANKAIPVTLVSSVIPMCVSEESLPSPSLVTNLDALDRLLVLYSGLVMLNHVPSLVMELQFTLQLLTAKGCLYNSKDNATTFDPPCFFSSLHNCVYFASHFLASINCIISLLDRTILRLLADNKRLQVFVPALHLQLAALVDTGPPHQSPRPPPRSPMKGVAFQVDTDNRANFPDHSTFHIFRKQRDLFYELLREWEREHHSTQWRCEVFGWRVRALLDLGPDPSNVAHLGRLLVGQLLESCEGGHAQDASVLSQLQRQQPEKFARLQQRLVAPARGGGTVPPPSFPGLQEFFRAFLLEAYNPTLNAHFEDVLCARLMELLTGADQPTPRISSRLLLRRVSVLAKFLGLLWFSPYHSPLPLPQSALAQQVVLRSKVCLRVNLCTLIRDCAVRGQLVAGALCCAQLLSMADAAALHTAHLHTAAFLLIRVYRIALCSASSDTCRGCQSHCSTSNYKPNNDSSRLNKCHNTDVNCSYSEYDKSHSASTCYSQCCCHSGVCAKERAAIAALQCHRSNICSVAKNLPDSSVGKPRVLDFNDSDDDSFLNRQVLTLNNATADKTFDAKLNQSECNKIRVDDNKGRSPARGDISSPVCWESPNVNDNCTAAPSLDCTGSSGSGTVADTGWREHVDCSCCVVPAPAAIKTAFPPAVSLFLRLVLGWLFDLPVFPDGLFYADPNQADINKEEYNTSVAVLDALYASPCRRCMRCPGSSTMPSSPPVPSRPAASCPSAADKSSSNTIKMRPDVEHSKDCYVTPMKTPSRSSAVALSALVSPGTPATPPVESAPLTCIQGSASTLSDCATSNTSASVAAAPPLDTPCKTIFKTPVCTRLRSCCPASPLEALTFQDTPERGSAKQPLPSAASPPSAPTVMDETLVVDYQLLLEWCPQVFELRALLAGGAAEGATACSGATAGVRKIAPLTAVTVEASTAVGRGKGRPQEDVMRRDFQAQLQESFLHHQPACVRDCLLFVTEQLVSNTLRHVRTALIPAAAASFRRKVQESLPTLLASSAATPDRLEAVTRAHLQSATVLLREQVRGDCLRHLHEHLQRQQELLHVLLPADMPEQAVSVCCGVVSRACTCRVQAWLSSHLQQAATPTLLAPPALKLLRTALRNLDVHHTPNLSFSQMDCPDSSSLLPASALEDAESTQGDCQREGSLNELKISTESTKCSNQTKPLTAAVGASNVSSESVNCHGADKTATLTGSVALPSPGSDKRRQLSESVGATRDGYLTPVLFSSKAGGNTHCPASPAPSSVMADMKCLVTAVLRAAAGGGWPATACLSAALYDVAPPSSYSTFHSSVQRAAARPVLAVHVIAAGRAAETCIKSRGDVTTPIRNGMKTLSVDIVVLLAALQPALLPPETLSFYLKLWATGGALEAPPTLQTTVLAPRILTLIDHSVQQGVLPPASCCTGLQQLLQRCLQAGLLQREAVHDAAVALLRHCWTQDLLHGISAIVHSLCTVDDEDSVVSWLPWVCDEMDNLDDNEYE